MRSLILVLFLFHASLSSAGECLKPEYQELKEWTDEQLVIKLCEDRKDYKNHMAVEKFWMNSAKLSKDIGNIDGSLKDWEKSSAGAGKAKSCKAEMDRVIKILAQKGIEEEVVFSRCTK